LFRRRRPLLFPAQQRMLCLHGHRFPFSTAAPRPPPQIYRHRLAGTKC
jgi:hypothetical protein